MTPHSQQRGGMMVWHMGVVDLLDPSELPVSINDVLDRHTHTHTHHPPTWENNHENYGFLFCFLMQCVWMHHTHTCTYMCMNRLDCHWPNGNKLQAGCCLEAACCKVDNCEIDRHHFAAEVFHLHWLERETKWLHNERTRTTQARIHTYSTQASWTPQHRSRSASTNQRSKDVNRWKLLNQTERQWTRFINDTHTQETHFPDIKNQNMRRDCGRLTRSAEIWEGGGENSQNLRINTLWLYFVSDCAWFFTSIYINVSIKGAYLNVVLCSECFLLRLNASFYLFMFFHLISTWAL